MPTDQFSLFVEAPLLLFFLCAVLPTSGKTSEAANDYITLLEAAPLFLTRPHKNTVVRWANKGCYGIKLRTVRYGGKRLTKKNWVEKFNQAVLGATPNVYADSPATSSTSQQAVSQLDAMGPSNQSLGPRDAQNFRQPGRAMCGPNTRMEMKWIRLRKAD
jgi:hypothetical protein